LRDIAALCREHGATLALDDAHGTGVLGPNGGGTAEHFGVCDDVEISMGTFSKTFGVTGGFIAGRRELIDYLRYFSRSYMFSAHLPQPVVAAVSAGIDVLRSEPGLRQALHRNTQELVRGMNDAGFDVRTESAIVPVVLPESIEIRKLGRRLHEEGLFCNLIETPAVAPDAQRIRLSLMATHSQDDVRDALGVLTQVGREFDLI
ncbi:MAG: aminotransferase class I/II-fold pyridoxal phosphate-dependent enzyme, partial [Deltaproteobacteria bacterium]|nr:aminotransferase class I/II-fold pyridoxal phosphate-dependent enzyme [Deltaproteobacteria bacterium]